jgi:hypothetical protein
MLLFLLLYLLGGAIFLWMLIATSNPDPETEILGKSESRRSASDL